MEVDITIRGIAPALAKNILAYVETQDDSPGQKSVPVMAPKPEPTPEPTPEPEEKPAPKKRKPRKTAKKTAKSEPDAKDAGEAAPPETKDEPAVTRDMIRTIIARIQAADPDNARGKILAHMKKEYKVDRSTKVPKEEYGKFYAFLETLDNE